MNGSTSSQEFLFADTRLVNGRREYQPLITASENRKGVMDVDTVKGCTCGMAAYPNGGCYGECYAYKTAHQYGIEFSVAVARKLTPRRRGAVFQIVRDHAASWYRVGTFGDPCHDWANTIEVCEYLQPTGKVPVVITKHWRTLSDQDLLRFGNVQAVFNTSVSGMDTEREIEHRRLQMERLKQAGIRSVCRVVTCKYGDSKWARACKAKQDHLLSLVPIIDNPLRASRTNPHVIKTVLQRCRVIGLQQDRLPGMRVHATCARQKDVAHAQVSEARAENHRRLQGQNREHQRQVRTHRETLK